MWVKKNFFLHQQRGGQYIFLCTKGGGHKESTTTNDRKTALPPSRKKDSSLTYNQILQLNVLYNCRCPETLAFTYLDKHNCIKLHTQSYTSQRIVRNIVPLHDQGQSHIKSAAVTDLVTNFVNKLGSPKVWGIMWLLCVWRRMAYRVQQNMLEGIGSLIWRSQVG